MTEELDRELEEQEAKGQEQDLAIETRAKQLGWVPKEKFRGDPTRWIPAADFVERGETEIPLILANNRELAGKLDKMERKFSNLSDTLERFNQYHETTLQREQAKAAKEYQRGLDEAQGKMRQAAEEGDVVMFDAAKAEADQITKDAAALNETPVQNKTNEPPKADPEVSKVWVGENPWFIKDFKMNKYARECGDFLAFSQPELKQREQLDRIAEMVKEEFPDYFVNPAKKRAAAVDTGDQTASPGNGRGKKGYNDLPREAQNMFKSLEAEIKGYTIDKYMATYNGPFKS